MKPRYNIGDLVAFGQSILSVVSVVQVEQGMIGVYWAYAAETDDKQEFSSGLPERLLRPLTPEELAAYALGWRGPVAQEPAS